MKSSYPPNITFSDYSEPSVFKTREFYQAGFKSCAETYHDFAQQLCPCVSSTIITKHSQDNSSRRMSHSDHLYIFNLLLV